MKAFAIALLAGLALPALAHAEDAKSILESGLAKWNQTYQKGDAAALTALYTSDAALMPDGTAQPIVGATAIRQFFDGWLKQRLENTAINLNDARNIDPKTIWAYGTWSGDIPGQNGGNPTHVGGTWMSVSVQDGADWKLRADTWNMMPPPAATTTARTDLEGVKAASQAFYSALNARDATAMAKVYAHTPFVAYIPPVGSEVAVGWEAVNKTWEDVFTKVTKQINMSYNREGGPQIDGNTAWEVGIEKGPVTFADGKTVDFGVLSTNIYQKIDGRWQMISHQAGQIPTK
jgi:uncharacterized protein (TIGR02246 family)